MLLILMQMMMQWMEECKSMDSQNWSWSIFFQLMDEIESTMNFSLPIPSYSETIGRDETEKAKERVRMMETNETNDEEE